MNLSLNQSPSSSQDPESSSQQATAEFQRCTWANWHQWACEVGGEWIATGMQKAKGVSTTETDNLAYNPTCHRLLSRCHSQREVSYERLDLSDYLVAAPLPTAPAGHRLAVTAVVAEIDLQRAIEFAQLRLEIQSLRVTTEELKTENEFFAQQVSDDFEEMTFLRNMAENLAVTDETLSIGQVVANSLKMLHGILGAEVLCFVEGQLGGQLECSVRLGDTATHPHETLSACEALANRFTQAATAGPLVKNFLDNEEDAQQFPGAHQLLLVPITTGVKQFGWFLALNRGPGFSQHGKAPLLCSSLHEFGTWEASLLSTAASVIASHASNLEHLREKGQLLINVVRSLVSAVEAKDAYTCGHSERVALYSRCIAEHLDYDEEAAEHIYLTGLLHDVGKIGVSDATLNKPGKLSDIEFSEIQEHPDYGWAILCELAQLDYVLPGVLHHHERYDGAGYPDGLSGEQIPLDARIMAVADAYDAMTSDRAYRAGLAHEKAISIIRGGAGTQWDPAIVKAFLQVVDKIVAIRDSYQPRQRPVRTCSALPTN